MDGAITIFVFGERGECEGEESGVARELYYISFWKGSDQGII